MRQFFLSGMCVVGFSMLIGCGSKIDGQIQQSVQANLDARNIAEWETSAAHPQALFQEWRGDAEKSLDEKVKTVKAVCEQLIKLDGVALTIFEKEIRDTENADLLDGCKDDLLQKINEHFFAERKSLNVKADVANATPSANSFKFPEVVAKRDYSNGYLVYSGDVGKKELVLSFDDGPSAQYTRSILQSLKEVNAKAHFFELGKSVRANPELTKMVAANGHMVGSHTVSHRCIGNFKECGKSNGGRQLSFESAVAEIKGGHQAIFDVLGFVDPIFRFPYGASSAQLREFLKENSTGEYFWSIDSEDWRAQSNEHLLKNTLAQIDARGRGVVLFHDIQRRTAEIMPQFLKEVYSRGYTTVLLQPMDSNAKYNSKLVKRKLP